jgi:hypothetical protein
MMALIVAFPLAWCQAPVPTVEGDAGPCSVEFKALDENGNPVYAAQIRVQFKYGFLGLHQADLQVATNARGVARFEGLPNDSDGVLFFSASTGDLDGVAAYYPAANCRGHHTI